MLLRVFSLLAPGVVSLPPRRLMILRREQGHFVCALWAVDLATSCWHTTGLRDTGLRSVTRLFCTVVRRLSFHSLLLLVTLVVCCYAILVGSSLQLLISYLPVNDAQVGANGTPEEKEAWLVRMHSCLNGNEPSGNGTNEDPGIVFASLDLQPSWKLYVDTFGYEFAQWDMHKSGALAVCRSVLSLSVLCTGSPALSWSVATLLIYSSTSANVFRFAGNIGYKCAAKACNGA